MSKKKNVSIVAISDLHGILPQIVAMSTLRLNHVVDGILIIAGDCLANHSLSEIQRFVSWLENQRFEHIIIVAGNHDEFLEKGILKDVKFTYLCDNSIEIEGTKFYGSPWVKSFKGMNPKCKAFTLDSEEELEKKWEFIPEGLDILITHSPMYGILDKTKGKVHWGSPSLRKRIEKVKPDIHICGHIHEAYGNLHLRRDEKTIRCYNVSLMNEEYEFVNEPTWISL